MRPVSEPIVTARDVSYRARGYRSFEFASFSVLPGEVHVLFTTEHAPARDLLLAVAGLVRPSEGSLSVCGVELAPPAHRRADRLRRAFGTQERLPRGAVGLGVFDRVIPVAEQLTVEEAVTHEFQLRSGRSNTRVAQTGEDAAPENASQQLDAGFARDADTTGVLTVGGTEALGHVEPGDGAQTDDDTMAHRTTDESDVLPFLAELGLATAAQQQVSRLAEPMLRARLSTALALAGMPAVSVVDLTDSFVAGLSAQDAAELVADARRVVRSSGMALLVATSELACAAAADTVTALDIPAAEILAAAEDRIGATVVRGGQDSARFQEVTAS